MKWIGALSRQLGGGGGIRAEDWVCELERERERAGCLGGILGL